MKKKMIATMMSLMLMLSGMIACNGADGADDEVQSAQQETAFETDEETQTSENEITETENEITETENAIVSPLPTTIDINNIKDCILAVSIEDGSIYTSKTDAAKHFMKVKVYDYEKFDLVDVSLLEVGNVIEINKEQVEIVSLERNALGTVIINGGLDIGGFELVTNENGVFYSIGYSDVKTYYELGEVELEIASEFIYVDGSDLDAEEKVYTLAELIAKNAEIVYEGTPHNTFVVVEDGLVTSMKKVYTP